MSTVSQGLVSGQLLFVIDVNASGMINKFDITPKLVVECTMKKVI